MRHTLSTVLMLSLLAVPPGYAQVQRDPNTGTTSTGPWSGPNRTPPPNEPWHRPAEPSATPSLSPQQTEPRHTGKPTPTPRPLPTYKPFAQPSYKPTPTPRPVVSRKPAKPFAMPPGWAWRNPGPSVKAKHGAVACVNGQASRVGVQILEKGGNAVDAAIAVAFALAVVYPVAGNLGGGGFMIVRNANGEVAALDYRETAPGRASRNMFLDPNGNLTPASRVGALSVGVPGTVAGMEAAHKRFGHLPWAQLVAPAIALARDGFIVNANLAGSFRTAQDSLLRFEETRRVFLQGHTFPQDGWQLKQPDLARTLGLIASQGAKGFYQGRTAQLIAADQAANGGLITMADLAHYQVKWRQPIQFTYRGHRVYSMPPPSSGGVALAEIMNILEGVNLGAMGWGSPEHLHWVAEAQVRAFADRNAYLGDPEFVPNQPVSRLISKEYAAKRRSQIQPDRATPSKKVVSGLEKEQTTHFSVIDKWGNAVSSTYTLNGLFGSCMVAKGTGVVLNDEMDDFAAKPGKANQFGLVQGEKNAVQPHKRPLSSMTPAIVLDPAGHLEMAIGSPGGPTIITVVAQVLSNLVDFHLPLNAAVAAPRVHQQDQPDLLFFEPEAMPLDLRVGLVHMGHHVQQRVPIGDAQVVLRHPDGQLEAYSDPRHGGESAGY
ncbi:MAG: gamma-glutamyltransferase 1, Threonine peptidase family [Cyanobacteria bacterium RYN_339]|nr:gamma-glutamyltransferase 1, Threonine peptidase family [Cyanobacteria bacterium RYN_339]